VSLSFRSMQLCFILAVEKIRPNTVVSFPDFTIGSFVTTSEQISKTSFWGILFFIF
jgi:hypothetical protein